MVGTEMSLKGFFNKYPWVLWSVFLILIIIVSTLVIAQRKENARLRLQNSMMNPMRNAMIPAAMIQGNGMMPAMIPQGNGMMPAMMPQGNGMMPAMMPQGNGMMPAMMPAMMQQGLNNIGNTVCNPPDCVSPNPSAPLITRNAVMPHGWRGICSNCHAILGPRPTWIK